ncbi:MAG: 3-isopropylmalate dehydratase small subunit [Pseudomonadota bacterium]
MTFPAIKSLTSRTVVTPQTDIDTDQIIPARFLTTTERDGLGEAAFRDWRFDAEGRPRNDDPFAGVDRTSHQILVAGANFGCGSSREHAPWALLDFGIRAVVSTDIADIFTSNALKNGLLAIAVDAATHARLLAAPGVEATIDLETMTLDAEGETTTFDLDPFARRCLLDGVDPLGFLLNHLDDIRAFEANR